MHLNKPVDWLREFLEEYRKIYGELTPRELASREFSLCDFSKVCEIHWIRLVKPDIQFLIVRHLPPGNADALYAYESIPYSDAPKRLEEVLSLPPFQRRLTPEELERFHITEEMNWPPRLGHLA